MQLTPGARGNGSILAPWGQDLPTGFQHRQGREGGEGEAKIKGLPEQCLGLGGHSNQVINNKYYKLLFL